MEKVYVFGAGMFYKRHKEQLNKDFIVEGVIDNSPQENVICPNSIKYDSDTKILIMARDFFDITKQLVGLGVAENNILFGDNYYYDLPKDKIIRDNSKIEYIDNKIYFITDEIRAEITNILQLYEYRKQLLRKIYSSAYEIKHINNFAIEPVTRDWGMSRGTAIDRFYIERFLNQNKNLIKGATLEIGDNSYTIQYGNDSVKSYILHVWGWGNNGVIKGNLETGEGLENLKFDTLILTQTLMFIYDLKKVVENIWNILNEGGHALITVAGISQISRYDANNWGSYWGFHKDALVKLFSDKFGAEKVTVETFGNVKLACAMLYGICSEEMNEADFEYDDEDYPIIHTILLTK